MSKNSVIKGTLILTITGFFTKLLGFYYRIFLTNLIGVQELGVYQLVFPIYIFMFAMCGQGFCQALTKHVSFYLGKNMPHCAKRVLMYAIFIAVPFSIVISYAVYKNAALIACYVLKNRSCAQLLCILSIAIPFVVLKALINAFFMGKNLPKYQGITQLIEQIIRITSAALLAYLLSTGNKNATLAVIAVVIGELCATLLTVFFYVKEEFSKKREDIAKAFCACQTPANAFRNDAIPMTINSMIFSLFTSFEAIVLPSMLYSYYHEKVLSMELFGIVTGIVLPFLLFPATITTSLSSMLLPTVSFAGATNNYIKIKKTLSGSAFFCLLLGVLASLFYMILGNYICDIAFHNQQAGILLRNMSFLCPFIYISGNLSAIINGMDMAFTNLVYNVIGISIRIACSFICVPIWGIKAYIYGIATSYIIIDILQYKAIIKRITVVSHSKADMV